MMFNCLFGEKNLISNMERRPFLCAQDLIFKLVMTKKRENLLVKDLMMQFYRSCQSKISILLTLTIKKQMSLSKNHMTSAQNGPTVMTLSHSSMVTILNTNLHRLTLKHLVVNTASISSNNASGLFSFHMTRMKIEIRSILSYNNNSMVSFHLL